jgi:hypothetical protein
MIAEVLHYLLTPCPWAARRSGHLAAAVSLWSRAGRCRKAWAGHEARCREFVARAVAELPRRRAVLVLGSGLARDIDLPVLAASFAEVILADRVHLWPVRLRARRFPNVRLVSADLAPAPGADPLAPWRERADLDLVVSANLLSQLPLLPTGRAAAPESAGREIVAGHLEGLRRFGCRVVLLTDVVSFLRARDGRRGEERDLLHGVPPPPAEAAWEWTVAPFGEDDAAWERIHRVRAVAGHDLKDNPG